MWLRKLPCLMLWLIVDWQLQSGLRVCVVTQVAFFDAVPDCQLASAEWAAVYHEFQLGNRQPPQKESLGGLWRRGKDISFN